MNARQALADLLRESLEYRRFFKRCCETSAFRLRAQAWQFREELRDRGHEVDREDLEDALLMLARKVLPETPAALWDAEWASELCTAALLRVGKRYKALTAEEKAVVDLLSVQDGPHEESNAAAEANDPAAFRAAMRAWERVGVEAIEAARKGAA
jgi:hypothetical protein